MPFFRRDYQHTAAYCAKLMHSVFVKERSKNGFNPDRFLIPSPYRNPFKDRSYLYCEALVLYILLREKQSNPKYEELLLEYEKIIFPAQPTAEALAKVEKIKSAMNDFSNILREDMTLSWTRSWFQAIGYNNANPVASTLLMTGFSATACGIKESLQNVRAASVLWVPSNRVERRQSRQTRVGVASLLS